MTTLLLVVILIILVINHIAVRALQVEIKSIKNDLSFIDNENEKEADTSTHDMISSMHDSLLSEIQSVDEKVEDIQDKISPNDELGEDDLYAKALEIVQQSKKCSTSLLQRKLRVGYSRAARLVDMLEENGIVSPMKGSEPREVLIKY